MLAALPVRTACALLARLPCIALYCTLALRILLRCCQALPSTSTTHSQCHLTVRARPVASYNNSPPRIYGPSQPTSPSQHTVVRVQSSTESTVTAEKPFGLTHTTAHFAVTSRRRRAHPHSRQQHSRPRANNPTTCPEQHARTRRPAEELLTSAHSREHVGRKHPATIAEPAPTGGYWLTPRQQVNLARRPPLSPRRACSNHRCRTR